MPSKEGLKRSTIRQIVDGILAEGEFTGDLDYFIEIANEATIYLKMALVCEEKGIDKAMEYFMGTHDENEYAEFVVEADNGDGE